MRSISRFRRSTTSNCQVRVRAGIAYAAKWTLLPASSDWRTGGPQIDIERAIALLPRIRGAVFWDFGAQAGMYTVGLARLVGPAGQVAAFEPDPIAFRRLFHHVEINELPHVVMFQAEPASDDRVNSPSGETGLENATKLIVDSLVEPGNIRLPDLIKVDVAG
jgi:FkbM family methyltransferase